MIDDFSTFAVINHVRAVHVRSIKQRVNKCRVIMTMELLTLAFVLYDSM